MVNQFDDAQLGEALLSLAREAGAAIMEVRQGLDLSVEHKADDSPVTAADMAAHRVLAQGLPKLLSIPVVSEEDCDIPFSERRQWSHYWLIDPLDGTKEFIAGNDQFCINIALMERNAPYLGVVHAPVSGDSYLGSSQLGAWKYPARGKPVPVRARSLQLNRPLVALTSHRHGQAAVAPLLQRMAERWSAPVETQPMGSALKICHLAEGLGDIYPRLGPTSEWDTGAPHAILNAAGGAIVGTDFQPLEYNTKESLLNPDFYALGDPKFQWTQLLDA
ncbi:3'(2'),5'-bisphosphate nucleotidase CysQ [Marinimicrobium sp. ABcell2]|uniref:3'(2'),5'-bisphosphate nucleotidase CysQ n=1 Tax=Marinimicrobium sp. ABcell2 TaxID=3069751 RepID=UPI0027B635F4|nr:3'(2'),5'-bisphosphate nucleotidase CysQ [Marinimicrobium sp. ABcell2]MDQ2076062.1 3'(2'),5'-bisphosphate nucleotidase CysQ [Marinimicrobium sp. ABcell2]